MFILLKVISAVFLLAFANATTANTNSAHVHGHAKLTIAIEQNSVDLNLIAPAESLLGFEHKATTSDELSQVATMKKRLSQHANIIRFYGAGCQVKKFDIDTNRDDHAHMQSHAEVTVNYQYHCVKAKRISSATVKLFEHFAALDKVEVMWLNSSKQGSIELNAKNITINFQ